MKIDQKETKKIIEGLVKETSANKEVIETVSKEETQKNTKKAQKRKKYPTYESMNNKYCAKQKAHKQKYPNPNKPLPNPRHELLARKLAMGAKKKEAYISVYNSKESTAINRSSALINSPSIKERYRILLEQSPKTSTKAITQRIETLIDATKAIVVDKSIEYVPDNGIRLETIKHIHKIQGVIDDTPVVSNSFSLNKIDIQQLDVICSRIDDMTQKLISQPLPLPDVK